MRPVDVGDLALEELDARLRAPARRRRGRHAAPRASRTARPRLVALVTVWRTPQSLTSRPVRGALQVADVEPTSVQTLRDMRSIHFQLAALATIASLSRQSTSVSGYICRSPMAKRRHLRFRIGAAHGVGVDDRNVEHCAGEEGRQRVAAADLHAHHGAERLAGIFFHQLHGAGEMGRIDRAVPGRRAARPSWRRPRPRRCRQAPAGRSAGTSCPRDRASSG